jgi:hypothetical protein
MSNQLLWLVIGAMVIVFWGWRWKSATSLFVSARLRVTHIQFAH